MRTRKLAPRIGAAALTLTALALASQEALAAEYWLKAGAMSLTLPDPTSTTGGTLSVAMWGYASCTDNSYGTGTGQSCTAFSVPGPALTVPAGESSLTVHLRNDLAVPTSLVVNGLYKPMVPVFTIDADLQARRRVRSFDAEAAPGGGITTYTWSAVNPGTYLYQSGTQPQVQVQMGLYGALAKNAVEPVPGTTRAQAYAGVANEYDSQATLLYSEIDPTLHAAVAGGTYGATGPTSTLNYEPKYFLINGAPFQFGSTPSIPAAGTTLLRLLNAGLTTHVPSIQGKYWDLIAEDGKPYPFKQNQYTALMPAAKTLDLLLTPDIGGATYPIVDRRLNLSNSGMPNGGMLAFLSYGAAGVIGGGASDPTPNAAPVANPDNYSSIAGIELTVGVAQGVLGNDTDADSLPQPLKAVAASGPTTAGGSFALNANGSFTYKAPAVITTDPTADTFTYSVTDGKALSATPGTVTINLSAPALPPTTPLDNFNRADSVAGLGTNWDQAASTVTSNPNLQLLGNAVVAADTDMGGLAIWIDGAAQGAKQYASASATVLDKSALVLKATGGTTKQPANFVRVRVEGTDIVVATLMSGNGAAVYAKQASFPAAAGGTLSAVVDDKGLVTVFLDGAFKGGVQLPDVGAWKGSGRIGIQMQKPGAALDNFGGGTL